MTSKKEKYIKALKSERNLAAFILNESNFPGPELNIELAYAISEVADEKIVLALLKFEEVIAPSDDPNEFLCFCGVLALGKQIINGKEIYFDCLRKFASDPRWLIRDAVVKALRQIGQNNMTYLLEKTSSWADGNLYERCALLDAICDPSLFVDTFSFASALTTIYKISVSLSAVEHPANEMFLALRRTLSLCWSELLIVYPGARESFEKLTNIDNEDIRWIISENLKNKNLIDFNPTWAAGLSH
ncbi:MAG: hypothetical protein KKB34_01900 [Bacteroidetes bacterium]|nr:hypothetical protein [Bacteroidota bacterium]